MFCPITERMRRTRVATRIHVETILRHCVAIADLCRRFGARSGDATCDDPGAGLLAVDANEGDVGPGAPRR